MEPDPNKTPFIHYRAHIFRSGSEGASPGPSSALTSRAASATHRAPTNEHARSTSSASSTPMTAGPSGAQRPMYPPLTYAIISSLPEGHPLHELTWMGAGPIHPNTPQLAVQHPPTPVQGQVGIRQSHQRTHAAGPSATPEVQTPLTPLLRQPTTRPLLLQPLEATYPTASRSIRLRQSGQHASESQRVRPPHNGQSASPTPSPPSVHMPPPSTYSNYGTLAGNSQVHPRSVFRISQSRPSGLQSPHLGFSNAQPNLRPLTSRALLSPRLPAPPASWDGQRILATPSLPHLGFPNTSSSSLGGAVSAPSRPGHGAALPRPSPGFHNLRNGARFSPPPGRGTLGRNIGGTSAARTQPVASILQNSHSVLDGPQQRRRQGSQRAGSSSETAPAKPPTTCIARNTDTSRSRRAKGQGDRKQILPPVTPANAGNAPERQGRQVIPNHTQSRLRHESPKITNQASVAQSSGIGRQASSAHEGLQNEMSHTRSSLPEPARVPAGKRKASAIEDAEQLLAKRQVLAGASPQDSLTFSPALSAVSPYPSTCYDTSTHTTPDPEPFVMGARLSKPALSSPEPSILPIAPPADHAISPTPDAVITMEYDEDQDAEGEELDESEEGFEILQVIASSSGPAPAGSSTIQSENPALNVTASAIMGEESSEAILDADLLELGDIFDIEGVRNYETWDSPGTAPTIPTFYVGAAFSRLSVTTQQSTQNDITSGFREPPSWRSLTDEKWDYFGPSVWS